MNSGLTSHSAAEELQELDRVGQVVRDRSRWYRRYLLALGTGTIAYYAAVNLAAPASAALVFAIAAIWTAFITFLYWWSRSQPVMWRGLRPLRILLMVLYFTLVIVSLLLNVTVLHDAPWSWALGIIPALPCLIGSWTVLRR
ncbi:hypothetical protein [Allorhizocola rhizosphaerae]|uniref:hypothetical protein n=1 Tax=Allorhizocola rhizosphaerae TaxID=1872709 RepID=UPI000E3D7C6F|nr:hypothetical protein [Allorhizocola rhizosphaerae]